MSAMRWDKKGATFAPSRTGVDDADELIEADVVGWIGEVTNAAEMTIERRVGGGSRAGYAVTTQPDTDRSTTVWLRSDTGVGPQSHGIYTLQREAAVYRALADCGLPIAKLIAVHPRREMFLMECVYGQSRFADITDEATQKRIAGQFMAALAQLHLIDPATLDLPELGPVRSLKEHVLDEIEIWEAQYGSVGAPDPLIDLAFRWLRSHVPDPDGWPVALVQGDTGPGNLMYDENGLVAITDWEMAHFGDPHDDLAWIYVRDLQERFPDLLGCLADYERALGRRVDPRRLRYFLVLAQTRCAVGTRNGLAARDSRGEIANHLIYSTMHMRALADALALATGIEVPEPHHGAVADPGESPTSWLYDVALDDLRHVIVPAIEGEFAVRRAKGTARVIRYLRELERLTAAADKSDRQQLADLLGTHVDSVPAGLEELSRRIRTERVPFDAALAFCCRNQARSVQVAGPAMGALSERRYSPLPALSESPPLP